MDPIPDLRELEQSWEQSRHSDDFARRWRQSLWGGRIGSVLDKIGQQRSDAIEDAISFLEANPWYFRSGYNKAAVASKLKSVSLTAPQRIRLQQVILAATESRAGREFREYARLAVRVTDADFMDQVRRRIAVSNGWAKARLLRVLLLCDGGESAR
jgi:hypothetical protein